MRAVVYIGGALALAATVAGTLVILGWIDADGWLEWVLAPVVFAAVGAVVVWVAMYPGAIVFGSIEGVIEGARLEPAEDTAEAFSELTIREVRRRADALRGRKDHDVTADVWRRLERTMRAAGAWQVRDLGEREVKRWSRRLLLTADESRPAAEAHTATAPETRAPEPEGLRIRARPTLRPREPPPDV